MRLTPADSERADRLIAEALSSGRPRTSDLRALLASHGIELGASVIKERARRLGGLRRGERGLWVPTPATPAAELTGPMEEGLATVLDAFSARHVADAIVRTQRPGETARRLASAVGIFAAETSAELDAALAAEADDDGDEDVEDEGGAP